MHINNYIEHIFSNKSKVIILRFMIRDDTERSGREIARFTGISHVQVHRILKELNEESAVIIKSRGRSLVCRINKNNYAVKNILEEMFKKEQALFGVVLEKHFKSVIKTAKCVVLFGSVFEKNEKAASDIDLFFLCYDEKEKKKIEKQIEKVGADFIRETGNMISPLIMTLVDYKRALKENKTIIENIRNANVIKGKLPDRGVL